MSQLGGSDVVRAAVVAAVVLFGVPLVTGALMMSTMGARGVPEVSLLVALLVPFAVGLLVVLVAVRALADGGERDEALEELRRAYARGDLSDEEFERRRERLRED